MSKRVLMIALAGILALSLSAPAFAQNEVVVSVQDPSFSWAGKRDQTVNYEWSATVDNPSRKDFTVNVTLEFLDAEGTVVATDRRTADVDRESSAAVESSASITWAQAQQATQYRVTLAEVVEG